MNQNRYLLFLQSTDEFIEVHYLETSDDHGILDPDDLLCDVVDDKDKVQVLLCDSYGSLTSYIQLWCFSNILLVDNIKKFSALISREPRY